MSCSECGMPCQGDMCSTCENIEYLEGRYGVPSDHIDYDEEDQDDGDE